MVIFYAESFIVHAVTYTSVFFCLFPSFTNVPNHEITFSPHCSMVLFFRINTFIHGELTLWRKDSASFSFRLTNCPITNQTEVNGNLILLPTTQTNHGDCPLWVYDNKNPNPSGQIIRCMIINCMSNYCVMQINNADESFH